MLLLPLQLTWVKMCSPHSAAHLGAHAADHQTKRNQNLSIARMVLSCSKQHQRNEFNVGVPNWHLQTSLLGRLVFSIYIEPFLGLSLVVRYFIVRYSASSK